MGLHYVPSLLDTTSVRPMDQELCEIFLKCTVMELHEKRENGKVSLFNGDVAQQMGEGALILWKRMELYGSRNPIPEISVAVAVIVALQCPGPGYAVCWAFTLNRMYQSQGENKEPIDMDVFSESFPIGFPDENGFREIWEAQKGKHWGEHVDNMLDNPNLLTDTVSDMDKQEWCKWLKV